MGSRDNLSSSNSNHSLNCVTPSQAAVNLKLCEGISAATSPLLENGKGGSGSGGSGGSGGGGSAAVTVASLVAGAGGGAHHKRTHNTQSPHDFRKDFEHNMENGEYFFFLLLLLYTLVYRS